MINLTDEKLYSLCKTYGAQALEARRKFLGLLPEVNRRDLAEKCAGQSWLAHRGFNSIFEFAYKMAGVSEKQVRIALNLEEKFKDKPSLYHALTTGEISVNKLARISVIATRENAAELSELAKILPQKALEVFVKEERTALANNESTHVGGRAAPAITNLNDPQKPLLDNKYLRAQTNENQNHPVELSNEVNKKLRELIEKGIDVNALLLDFLEKREVEIAQEKELIAKESTRRIQSRTPPALDVLITPVPASSHSALPRPAPQKPAPSRHIPTKVIRILRREFGNKCSIPNCVRDAKTIHHTARFAVSRSHDPRFMAPLCREHHLLAHNADMRFWKKRAQRA
jgi:hypothetical protein